MRKSISTGERYEYGEKVKEKRNYILYVSGLGYIQKEVEEEVPREVVKREEINETKNQKEFCIIGKNMIIITLQILVHIMRKEFMKVDIMIMIITLILILGTQIEDCIDE